MSPSFDPFMPNAEWTFGDAEKAYRKYIDMADEYNWTIEEINGEDWVQLVNAYDAIMELRNQLKTMEKENAAATKWAGEQGWIVEPWLDHAR